jgi:hypothetical protein
VRIIFLYQFYQPFKGCLRGLMMNGQLMTDVRARVNSLRCVDNVEDGVYFPPSNGEAHTNFIKVIFFSFFTLNVKVKGQYIASLRNDWFILG